MIVPPFAWRQPHHPRRRQGLRRGFVRRRNARAERDPAHRPEGATSCHNCAVGRLCLIGRVRASLPPSYTAIRTPPDYASIARAVCTARDLSYCTDRVDRTNMPKELKTAARAVRLIRKHRRTARW
jgi:hypothetical protein